MIKQVTNNVVCNNIWLHAFNHFIYDKPFYLEIELKVELAVR